ncbi:MAG: hypothetical protein HQL20_08340 [Candidatus Omnitrophica bacterium]|nr:hypothetical protein [Candidatus Omnitrophota bacterium]
MILNQNTKEIRVMVKLKEARMKSAVISLLEDNRGREAFELLRSKAEVEAYFPVGSRLRVRPDVTLFEDMCR